MENRLLPLIRKEKSIFVADATSLWVPPGARGVFGGQLIGLALRAAVSADLGKENEKILHSFHIHFLRAVLTQPNEVFFHVQSLQSGASMARRLVIARQGDIPVLSLVASFCLPGGPESPFAYQSLAPEGRLAQAAIEARSRFLDDDLKFATPSLPIAVGDGRMDGLIDLVAVGLEPVSEKEPRRWRRANWLRIRRPHLQENAIQNGVQNVDVADALPSELIVSRQAMQACLLGFLSDVRILPTGILGFIEGRSSYEIGMIVSLDHSVWIHKVDNLEIDGSTKNGTNDTWLLFETWGISGSGGRVLVGGRFWRNERNEKIGCLRWELVATVQQEGMVRMAKVKSADVSRAKVGHLASKF